jgi:long-chain acyl-CoA synthetase
VADRLVLSKVRDLFGTDLELVLTAPIATDVLEFFDACGVLVLEGYGLSDTTAAATLNTPSCFRFGTVGRLLTGVEVSIAPDGEILICGPNVFAGYFRDDPATRETLREDGWPRSGDLGSFDNGGFSGSPVARRTSSSPPAARASRPPTSRRRCAGSAGCPRRWCSATTAPTSSHR